MQSSAAMKTKTPAPATAKKGAAKGPATKAAKAAPAAPAAPSAAGLRKATPVTDKTVHYIPLNEIVDWPRNPRQSPDPQAVASIATTLIDKNGDPIALQTPISVMILDPAVRAYTVYMGSQRVGAHRKNVAHNLMRPDHPVACYVDDIDEETAYKRALIENVARADMNSIDRAEAIGRLADQHHNGVEIARIIGAERKDVQINIDVSRLDDRCKDLVRSGKRTFAWLAVLTQADGPLRNRILNEIEESPTAWGTIEQLRVGLKMTRIKASHAEFALEGSGVQSTLDFIDNIEWISDKEKFWELQNKWVDDKRDALESDGHAKVTVLRGACHEPHLYQVDPAAADRQAVIEISSDGKVVVHEDLVPLTQDGLDGLFDEGDADALLAVASGETITNVPPKGRAAKALIDALGDAAAATMTPLESLRVLVVAMMEADELKISSASGRTPAQVRAREEAIIAATGSLPDAKERIGLNAIPLDQDVLMDLVHKMVANGFGATRSRAAPFAKDEEPTLLRRSLAENPDSLRAAWTPDATLFEAMELCDLRGLCDELLGEEDEVSPASTMNTKQLVGLLASAFADAKAGTSLYSPDTQMKLAAWRPEYLL